MTFRQIRRVQQSWQTAAALDAATVGGLFYNRLFALNPELKPLFKSPQPEQSRKLVAMIAFVIAKLDKLEDILNEVQKLAHRHVRYGVEEAHYVQVGAALLWALEQGLGEAWDNELAEAWTACYTVLSSAMIDASAEALCT